MSVSIQRVISVTVAWIVPNFAGRFPVRAPLPNGVPSHEGVSPSVVLAPLQNNEYVAPKPLGPLLKVTVRLVVALTM